MPSSYVVGQHFEQFIRQQLDAGRYASASEVIRDGLRLLETRQRLQEIEIEEYREKIREGIASGPSVSAEEVFARLEMKYQFMQAKQA